MKRGRPPLDAISPSASVHLRLAPRDYDAADRLAKQLRQSIQTVVRRGLKKLLTERRPSDD